LNAGESLSLLKCKKPWTLVVAVFPGMSTIKPAATTDSFWDRLWNTKGPDGLSAGAINAHHLAEALRAAWKTSDVYVLHLRTGSLVHFGGFDRDDDPRMQSAQAMVATHLQKGKDVQLLPQPFAIEVPRPK